MEPPIDVLTRQRDQSPPPSRSLPGWAAVTLVVAGLAGGYLLGSTGDLADPAAAAAPEAADVTERLADRAPRPARAVEEAAPEASFAGTLLGSMDFGEALIAWEGGSDPVPIRLAGEVEAAAYDAARDRLGVLMAGYDGEGGALLVGRLGELRPVALGVVGFAWHPLDPTAIAWIELTPEGGHRLVSASVDDDEVTLDPVASLDDGGVLVAWGPWGYGLQADQGLVVLDPQGAPAARGDFQLVAAGPDGRLLVSRPAGRPLGAEWFFATPSLDDLVPLGRFGDLDEHPTAAAILPRSGTTVLVSNGFANRWRPGRVELLDQDGASLGTIRLDFIAESVAWSADETTLAVGGYGYHPTRLASKVALLDAGLVDEPIEVSVDRPTRPLGYRP